MLLKAILFLTTIVPLLQAEFEFKAPTYPFCSIYLKSHQSLTLEGVVRLSEKQPDELMKINPALNLTHMPFAKEEDICLQQITKSPFPTSYPRCLKWVDLPRSRNYKWAADKYNMTLEDLHSMNPDRPYMRYNDIEICILRSRAGKFPSPYPKCLHHVNQNLDPALSDIAMFGNRNINYTLAINPDLELSNTTRWLRNKKVPVCSVRLRFGLNGTTSVY